MAVDPDAGEAVGPVDGRPAAASSAVSSALPAVLVSGWPASGKSTVARALARRLGAALIDQDTATAPLVAVVADLVGTDDLDDPRLAGPTRGPRYETVTALAEDNLRIGTAVVLVAPFTAERRDADAWSILRGRLRAAGGVPLLVWLRLRPETVLQRLGARGAARDLAKIEDPDAYLADLSAEEPAGPHLAVDGELPTGEVVARVLEALAAPDLPG